LHPDATAQQYESGRPDNRHEEKVVTDAEARNLIAKLLVDYTAGSILHLVGDVLHQQAEDAERGDDLETGRRLRDAETALFVFGVGIDAVVGTE
jgi:hypothetical protein